jgi:hypothetical protein
MRSISAFGTSPSKACLRQYIVRLAAIGFISTQIKRKSVDERFVNVEVSLQKCFVVCRKRGYLFEQAGMAELGGFVMPTLDQEQSRLGILHACPRTAPVLIIVSAASAKRHALENRTELPAIFVTSDVGVPAISLACFPCDGRGLRLWSPARAVIGHFLRSVRAQAAGHAQISRLPTR